MEPQHHYLICLQYTKLKFLEKFMLSYNILINPQEH